jgi:hypothetical protein
MLYVWLSVVTVTGAAVWALVFLAPRWDRASDRWLALKERKQADRRQALDDANTERAKALREATKGRVVIPPDLEAAIFSESAKFAQDEMRSDILDRYALYGDWNKVRSAVGIGHMDEVPS